MSEQKAEQLLLMRVTRDDNGLRSLSSLTPTLASSSIALGVRVNVAVEGAEGVVPAEDADGSALLREVARRLPPGGRARRRRLEAVPASVTICKRLPGLVIEFPCLGAKDHNAAFELFVLSSMGNRSSFKPREGGNLQNITLFSEPKHASCSKWHLT